MALYQPSNIIPSSFAGIGGGVVDVNDNVSISWQVNGNSPLLGEIIYIYTNDAASTLVHTYNPSLHSGFYGTDAQGNIQRYVVEPGVTWASWGLSNGNSYKMIIAQKYPSNAGSGTITITQNSASIFITRSAPTLTISPASGTLASVTQSFTASFSQAQYDSIAWVRWVLSDDDGNVIDDTGTIYTGKLGYSYNGFFDGVTYTLSCTVETSSGATKTVTNTYACSYTSSAASGGIATSCNPDDSVTLSWAAGADIPGTPSAEDYGSIVDGVLHLAASRSITWNQVNGESMSFSSPYAFAWRGQIGTTSTSQQTINSGTWTKISDPTQTGTTSNTVTVSNLTLTKPYTGTGTHQFSVPATNYTLVNDSPTIHVTGSWDGSKYSGVALYDPGYVINEIPSIWSGNIDYIEYTGVTHTAFYVHMSGSSANLSANFTVALQVYSGSGSYTPAEGGVSGPTVSSTTAKEAFTSMSGNTIVVAVNAASSGTYTVNVSYSYTYAGNDSYSGSTSGTLSSSLGTLTSATVTSTTGTGGASVSTSGNNYTVAIRNNSASSCTATVSLSYKNVSSGDEAYRSIVTVTVPNAISATVISTTSTKAIISETGGGIYTLTMYYSSATSRTATVNFTITSIVPHDSLLELNSGVFKLYNTEDQILFKYDNLDSFLQFVMPSNTYYCLAIIKTGTYPSGTFEVHFYDYENNEIGSDSWTASDMYETENPITSVKLTGEQYCDYVYITSDVSYQFPTTGAPGWNGSTLFNASFAENLQAGTLSSSDSLSVAIYRKEGTALIPLGVYDSTVSTIRDYGIRSRGEYQYILYYISDDTYSVGMLSDEICKQFRQFTLIEATQDTDDQSVYHPVSVWRFRNNIEAGAVSNGNNPAMLENFTKYPLWQPSSQAPKSGTLTALLSFFSEGEYIRETAADMERLYALSQSVNPLFLRDMKGNLYMVRLSGPISQTVNYKTGVMEVTVSVPWVEVGDAEDVKIISIGG